MYGAIIGDIAGSKYEFISNKIYPAEIMDEDCFFTDDTVCTVALTDAIINGKDPASTLRNWCRKYPDLSYGGAFNYWINNENMGAYNSFGNGAAMRVSGAAWLGNDLEEVKFLTNNITIITHDHEEGIRGAQATAEAIFYARLGKSKDQIKNAITNDFGYDLRFSCDRIRDTYTFNETCQETVPQAIVAFLDSSNFDDAIRLAISLGGDADTLAAITGSIAEAFYGIPNDLIYKCKAFLPDEFIDILDKI